MAEKMMCPDCGHHMIRTWTSKHKTRIRIKCSNCEFGIEIEPKQENKCQELLEEAGKQWAKAKKIGAEKDVRIAREISLMFEKPIKKMIRKHRGKAVKELLRIICGVLGEEVCWYHSFRNKLVEEEIDRLAAIAMVILNSCYKVQEEIGKIRWEGRK